MPFDYYRKSNTPKRSGGKAEKEGHEAAEEEKDRKKGLTKSIVKRKRTLEEEDDTIKFSFTPTHPDKRRSHTSGADSSDSATIATTRPKRIGAKKAAVPPSDNSNADNSSKKFVDTVEIGVKTKIPSKASANEGETKEDEESSAPESADASQPRTGDIQQVPTSTNVRKKRKTLSRDPTEEEMEPNEPKRLTRSPEPIEEEEKSAPSTPSSSTRRLRSRQSPHVPSTTKMPRKGRKGSSTTSSPTHGSSKGETVPTTVETDIWPNDSTHIESEDLLPAPEPQEESNAASHEIPATASTSQPRLPHSSESLAKGTKTSKSRPKPTMGSKSRAKSTSKSSLPLEENLVSYWDFVRVDRSERLIRRLTHTSSDGTRRVSAEAEKSLRYIQTRFFADAETKFRPADEYEHNPLNDQLEGAKERYARIVQLLERENQELEAIHDRLTASLEAAGSLNGQLDEASGVKTPSKRTSGPGSRHSSAKKSATKKPDSGPTNDNSLINVSTVASVSVMDDILLSLPPGETLLTEEDRLFLAERPARSGDLELASFAHLQTKLDAIELLSRQITYINDTFEQKATSVSAAMRDFMVPVANAPRSLASLPPASPGFADSDPFRL